MPGFTEYREVWGIAHRGVHAVAGRGVKHFGRERDMLSHSPINVFVQIFFFIPKWNPAPL